MLEYYRSLMYTLEGVEWFMSLFWVMLMYLIINLLFVLESTILLEETSSYYRQLTL